MNNGKKFDVCLMNPPYDKNLHLKFLEKVIGTAEKTVSISPGGFLQDIGIYSNNKVVSNKLVKHLKDYEFLDFREGNDLFKTGNGIQSNLHIGVYVSSYKDGKPLIDEDIYRVYDKIRYTCKKNFRNYFVKADKFKNYGVKIYRYHRKRKDAYYDNIICITGRAVEGIDFKTEDERKNFIDSIHSWVYEFMYNIKDTNPAHLPYLDDYTKPWTDERLYKLFNITKEDKEVIDKVLNDGPID